MLYIVENHHLMIMIQSLRNIYLRIYKKRVIQNKINGIINIVLIQSNSTNNQIDYLITIGLAIPSRVMLTF